MNKYLIKGMVLIAVGIVLNLIGYSMKQNLMEMYGWLMLAGTLSFGIGFLLAFYSLVRKVEYDSVLEERAVEAEKKARREAQSRRHRRTLQVR